jgi:F-type H+-transporting ATPase subunit c
MELVRKVGAAFLIMVGSLMLVGSATAQPKDDTTKKQEELEKHKRDLAIKEVEAKRYGQSWHARWGAGLGAGLVIIGAGLGFGRIGGAALEGMARQPEVANKVQTAMIIIGALLEGATFFGLIVCILAAG